MYVKHKKLNSIEIWPDTAESEALASKYNLEVYTGETETGYDGALYVKGTVPVETYIEKRLKAYPEVGEQLDLIYWDKVNGTNNWQQTIAAIKEEYPKNESNSDSGNSVSNV